MEVFMINKYDVEFKKKIVRQFRDECQINEKSNNEYNYTEENLRLRKELEEVKKENEFLKKAATFFTKEID